MWYNGLIHHLGRTGAKLRALVTFMVFVVIWSVLIGFMFLFMRGIK